MHSSPLVIIRILLIRCISFIPYYLNKVDERNTNESFHALKTHQYTFCLEKFWVVSLFLPSTKSGNLVSAISEAINGQKHPHHIYWELWEHCYSYSYTAIQRALRVNAPDHMLRLDDCTSVTYLFSATVLFCSLVSIVVDYLRNVSQEHWMQGRGTSHHMVSCTMG